MYTRKTIDTFTVEFNEGFGWEHASTHETMEDAKFEIETQQQIDDIEQGVHCLYRIKCKRVSLAIAEKAFI